GAEDTQRTEIWYGPGNSLEAATKLTDLAYPQSDYSMQNLAAGARFFFWARLVDRTGNVGPFYPVVNGVMGQASSDAGPILDILTGKVTKTQLGQDLLSELDGLQDQIDALDGLKGYDPAEIYLKGQMVVEDGRIYQAIKDVPANNPPPAPAFWSDVGQSVETANGLAQQVATNTADITELDGVVTAQASATSALRASWREDDGSGDLADAIRGWNNTAAIVTEEKVRATAIEAEATRTTKLQASVGENTAAIQETSSALANTKGQLETLWSVKMEATAGGQKYAASFGLGLQVDPSGVSSQFVVRADTFMLLNLINGTPVSPFSVSGGQTFIRSAFIQEGSIDMLKIGSNLQSSNYVPDVSGWAFRPDGTFQMMGNSPGGSRLLINNKGIFVYHANGVKGIDLSLDAT
ncbi:phage tail protein, partial [Pseudomonas sp. Fl4BN1]|uniref:phage tail protein n=1 Tax=Pseudomonas sp. Fl4BN1 TaxID=2697651 RepID=UPI001377D570